MKPITTHTFTVRVRGTVSRDIASRSILSAFGQRMPDGLEFELVGQPRWSYAGPGRSWPVGSVARKWVKRKVKQ